VTAPLTEAESGAALFGWLAEGKVWKRSIVVEDDDEGTGYMAMLDSWHGSYRPANGFSGATRAEALTAAARWVMQGKGGERG
jgi:hypothetical protein